MPTTRTIDADVADLAASWLAGLALAFERCQFADEYVAVQAPVNADWLRRAALALGGPSWIDSAPGRELVQVLMAIDSGCVPDESWPGSDGQR